MSMSAVLDKAKTVMNNMIEQNRAATLASLGDLSVLVQQTLNDERSWPVEDLKRFNGLMKYILMAVENNDLEFGINVINSDLLPLFVRVMLRDSRQAPDDLAEKIDAVTGNIKDQYTDFMYPNLWNGTIPAGFQAETTPKALASSLYNLDYVQHMAFKTMIPAPKLEILVAGCGTGEAALACALIHPAASFTFVDISPASLALTNRYAAELKVENVRVLHDDIVTMDLGRKFDIIISTGVIHHLSIPSKGVENLRRHLKDTGALAAMVYGEYGRFEIGLFQEALKTIMGGSVDFVRGIELVKMLLAEVEPQNRMVNIAWKQDLLKGEQHLVDLLLNVNENRYNIDSLSQMIADGSMRIVDFPNRATLNPDNYVKSQKMKEAFAGLPFMARCRLAELINGKLSKHCFYAVATGNDFEPLSIHDACSMDYTLHKSPYLIEKTIVQNKTRQNLLGLNHSALEEEYVFPAQDLEIDEGLKKLLELCDGKNKVGYIFNKFKGKIKVPEAKKFLHDAIVRKMLFLHV